MNKTDLIERISADTNVSKAAAAKAIETVISTITAALKRGDHCTLSGFGSFTTYQRKARNGRNPQTGALITIGGHRVAKFSPGVELKKAVKKG